MLKKVYGLILSFSIFILLFIGQTVYADENYKVWNTNGVVTSTDSNKTINVTFNKDVDVNSAKDFVKVYEDDNNSNIAVNISSANKNILQISPKESYVEGKSYTLTVSNGLKDIYGNTLNQSVKYNFKIDEIKKPTSSVVTNTDSTSDDNAININSYTDYYNALKKALSNYDSKLVVNINNYDKNTYSLSVIDKVMDDSPDLRAWYESASCTITYSSPVNMSIEFKYSDTKDNLVKKDNLIKEKVSKVVNSVTDSNMKDYEKELAIHDYVVNNTKYDQRAETGNMPTDSYTAYGVLINGIGVCQGYADAMYRLLTAAGIENTMVIGEANNGDGTWVGHAWNVVKIQGQYYDVDTTWDDPVTSSGADVISHNYFNLTDSELSVDHSWTKGEYPQANGTEYSYRNIMLMERRYNTSSLFGFV